MYVAWLWDTYFGQWVLAGIVVAVTVLLPAELEGRAEQEWWR